MRSALALLAVMMLAATRPAMGQRGTFIPLDDPVYGLIDALRARGGLRELSALERPYTVADVQDALAEQEGGNTRTQPLEQALRRWLDTQLGSDEVDALRLTGEITLGGVAQSTGRRELMLAADADGSSAVPFAHARLALGARQVSAVFRVRVDGQFKEDPEFLGRSDRVANGRVEDGYLSGRWRYGELFLGRMARNLGPAPLLGLQLGNAPYSYDHLFARLGTRRLHLASLVAPLDPYRFGTVVDGARADAHLPQPRPYDYQVAADSVAQRWFALHRLGFTLGAVEVGFTESTVWGGVDRGVELGLINPLNFWTLSQYSEKLSHNVSLGTDVAWSPQGLGVWSAQFMLDDVQIDDCGPSCDEPTSWAVSASAEGVPLAGGARAFGTYVRVSNLSYRTPSVWERYASYDVGLGVAQSDFDEARAGVEVAFPWGVVRPYVARRRQGEGDYRRPYPAIADYASTPAFLAGRPWVTTRAGVRLVAWAGAQAWVEGDLGYSRARAVQHAAGAEEDAFHGRIRVALRTGNFGLLTAR